MKNYFENYTQDENLNEGKILAGGKKIAKQAGRKGKNFWNGGLSSKDSAKILQKTKNLGKNDPARIKAFEKALRNKKIRNRAIVGAGAVAVGAGTTAAVKNKKKLNEAIEWGVSADQYMFDRMVVGEIKNLCESVEEFYDSKNTYYASQRDSALENGFNSAAIYYDERIIE
jgi:hypothetical protein